jgi:hypothetical protein
MHKDLLHKKNADCCFVLKNKNMYYVKSGGGENILAVILSCLDKFS